MTRKSSRLFQIPSLYEKYLFLDFSGPYFPTFELNMEIYSINLWIQSNGENKDQKNFD